MEAGLLQCSLENTKPFSLDGYVCLAKVLKCYDADTVTVALPYLGVYYRFSVRINGIDTCELRSKNELIKTTAYKARKALIDVLAGVSVTDDDYFETHNVLVQLNCKQLDKYGRLLAEIHTLDNIDVADYLLEHNYAYIYSGKTKLTEEEQIQFFNLDADI
jgi:endonuclease YncB( thermonuclease family)